VLNHERGLELYNEYKLEYRKQTLAEYFATHSEEEWFLEKYHPLLKVTVSTVTRVMHGLQAEVLDRKQFQTKRRLNVFMQLLVRGWFEVSLDRQSCVPMVARHRGSSRAVRKLLDAAIVLMEGGDEDDIAMLGELDYVLEEKKVSSPPSPTRACAGGVVRGAARQGGGRQL